MAARDCRPGRRRWRSGAAGFALVEALIAVAVVVSITTGVALLIVGSTREVWSAGTRSMGMSIAQQKLEQLLALEWRFDAAGTRRSDLTTDLSIDPADAGGTGLQPSPPGTLGRTMAGFADFVGADGRWRSGSGGPAGDAAFLRRWSIAAYAPDSDDTLVLTVVVFSLADGPDRGVRPAAARLQTIRTRTSR
jgi:hypothetical protein